MAKQPNLNQIGSSYNVTNDLNNNFERIAEAFENTLSLDGSTPNYMSADLDMNSNDIINARGIQAESFIVDGEDFSALLQRAIQDIQTALALVDMVTYTRVTLTYKGDGTSNPLILPLSYDDARYVDVFVNETRKYPETDYTVSGYDLIPTDNWPISDEDNILVLINKPYDDTAPTTDDITFDGTPLTSILNSLLASNIVRLTEYLHPDDLAAITSGVTAGQNTSRVTAAIRSFLEVALNKTFAVDGAQVTASFPPGIYSINDRLMSDTFNNTLWTASYFNRSRLWFDTAGSVTFRIQNWVPGRASIRTDSIYSGSTHIAPHAVFEWIQDTGRQNFGGMSGQWIIEGANSTTNDPIGFYFYRLNATHVLGNIECRNLRNRNFVFDSVFNSKFDYVRSANAAGLMLTEYGNSGLLPNDSVSGTVTTGLRYSVSGTTLTLNTMVYDSAGPSYSYTPATIFTADHVGKWIGLDRQGRENQLGDDTDGGNEGGSIRRSARWFQIASVTDASTAELTVAPSYQTGVDQWVPQNRTFSFEVLKVSTTAGSTVATLSMPTTLNLVGLEVVIPGAGYDGSAPRFPDLVAMVVGHSGSSITLSHAAKVSKSGVPLVTAPQLALSSLSHTVFASTSRKCDDVHFGRMWAESGAVPALPLHLHNVTNISTGRDSKLHGSPPSNPNFGANFACVMAGEVGATLNGRFTHSRHSRQFGMFYITGDRSELDIDDAELSSWTADDQTSIWYLDPANVATTRIWDIYFNARDYAHGFPSTAAGQVFERGSANWTAGRIKAGSSQKNPRGERPSWPPAYLPPARAPAYGSTYEDATSAQTRGWSPEAGVTYRIAGSDYLGVTAGTGNDGFNSLQGLKKPLVILAWGQSNTAGNGTGGSLRLNPRVRIFDTDASVPVVGTLFNRAAFGVRPIDKTSSGQPVNNAIAHAASRLADELDVDVYVIMVARGGVSIEAFLTDAILTANSWSRGAWPDLSGLVLDSLTAALPLVPGTPTTVDMVMSVHGEANRTDAPTVYADKYMALMTMLSDAGRIDKRNVRLVAGEISTNAHTRYYENHKAALDDIDQRFGSVSLPGFVHVSSVGIDVNAGDETHFSGYGLVEYGRRLANAALSRTIRNAIGTTRAHAVAACARGWRAGDGLLYDIDGLQYRGSVGATLLPGLPAMVPAKPYTFGHFGAVGDGVTDDTAAITAANASGLGPFDMQGRVYMTTALSTAISMRVFNGALITANSDGNQDIYRTRAPATNAEIATTGSKSPVIDWAGRNVLWMGTSVPQEGVGSGDSYPNLIAAALGFSVVNNAWAGSRMRWDGEVNIDPMGSTNQIKSLSMTAADVAAGLALYGAGSVFDDAYDLVTKASQMTVDARVVNAYKAKPFSVVVLDHNHNDRRNAPGTLTPPTFTITGVTIGASTVFALSSVAGITVGGGVTVRISGIAGLDYAFGRVTGVSGTNVTVAYDSTGLAGTFSTGTLTLVDRQTLYGSADFLVSAIRNSNIRYGDGSSVQIIMNGAPSEYTNSAFDVPIWSVNRRLEAYAAARGLSFFDVATAMDVKAADHLLYFPDSVHPTTLAARQVLARHWVEWMNGGAAAFLSQTNAALLSGTPADQNGIVYNASIGRFVPNGRLRGALVSVLADDFSDGNYTGWTATGATPVVIDAPWSGGGKAVQFPSLSSSVNSYISQSVSTDVGIQCEFDLWLPVVSGLSTGATKQIPLVQLRSTGGYLSLQVATNESGAGLRLVYFKTPNVDNVNGPKAFGLAANTKYRVKLVSFRTTAQGAGFYALFVDGALASYLETDDIGQSNVTNVRWGILNQNTGSDVTAVLGNFDLKKFAQEIPLNGSVTIGSSTARFINGLAVAVS